MKLFGKPIVCAICGKESSHKHKPKSEWNIDGPLCGDCYVTQMKKFYELGLRQKCVTCGIEKDVPDLWEPRYQWDMTGLLCKSCFDKKDLTFKSQKRSEEHTSELQSQFHLVCRLLLEKKKKNKKRQQLHYT